MGAKTLRGWQLCLKSRLHSSSAALLIFFSDLSLCTWGTGWQKEPWGGSQGALASSPSSAACLCGLAASPFWIAVSFYVTQALVPSPCLTRGLRRDPDPRSGKGLGEVITATWGWSLLWSPWGISQQAFSGGQGSSAKRNRAQEGWEDGHGKAGSAAEWEQWAGSHMMGIWQ